MIFVLQVLVWNAVEASLLGLAVALIIRRTRFTAPTRHALWLLVIVRLLVPPFGVHPFALTTGGVKLFELARDRWALASSMPDVAFPEAVHTISPVVKPEWLGPDTEPAVGADLASSIPSMPLPAADQGAIDRAGSNLSVRFGVFDVHVAESGFNARSLQSIWLWPWRTVAVAAWLAGLLVLFVLRIAQCVVLRRIVRHGAPVPAEVQAVAASVARRMQMRVPEIRIVAGPWSPTVAAIGPTVLLPRSLAAEFRPELVRAVLAHEFGHIKRRDHWVCFLEFAASLAYWWHPGIWWVCRRLRRCADEAADACAVAILDRHRYADSLLQVLEILVADRPRATAWGLALGERDAIARRLTMIMKGRLQSNLSWHGWLGIIVVGLAVLPASPLALPAQDGVEDTDSGILQSSGGVPAPSVPGGFQPADQSDAETNLDATQESKRSEQSPAPRQELPPAAPSDAAGGAGEPQRRSTRDTEQRLNELEEKTDRILQLLQAMQSERARNQPGTGMGSGMMGAAGMSAGGEGAMSGAADERGVGMSRMGMPGMPGMMGPRNPAASGSGLGMGASAGMMPGGGSRSRQNQKGSSSRTAGNSNFAGGDAVSNAPAIARPLSDLPVLTPDPMPTASSQDKLQAIHRELIAEMSRIESEQERLLSEFKRRRAELERQLEEVTSGFRP